jgi:predicted dipeptidase
MHPRLLGRLCLLLPTLALAKDAPKKDARCQGAPKVRAARFSAKALPRQSEAERYAEYVRACALDEVVSLTGTLVRFKTVSSEQPASAPEFVAMRRFLEGWAKQRGFGFRAVGKDDVFELSWGEGEPSLGLIFHGDVVPAPEHQWKHKPFVPRVEAGRLMGRGVVDDKGPIASALVSLAFARELGLKPQGKVLVIIGNGEEHDWKGMERYAATEPKPTHVISVDSDYPIMVAQSGWVGWHLEAATAPGREDAPGARIVDLRAGEFLTQVPDAATAKLAPAPGQTPEQLLADVKAAVTGLRAQRQTLKAEVKQDGAHVLLTTRGKAVHSSVAEQGHNALWDLAAVATRLPLREDGATALLQTVAKRFDGDHYGEKLGIAYSDALMGRLLVVPTVLRVEAGTVKLGINMRRPQGKDAAAFGASLTQAAEALARETAGRVKEGPGRHVGEPHVADTSGPLVTTLLEIYQRHRGEKDVKPQALRGGTYARLFPRAVDFGPSFPGELYTGHGPDESLSLESLDASTRLLAEALHVLALSAR